MKLWSIAMQKRDLQRSMYEVRGRSTAQRAVMAGVGAVCVAVAWWLLLGGGLHVAARWFGASWQPGDLVRRVLLAAALTIYYVRLLFTEFVFLRRGVSWSEALSIAPWLVFIYLLVAISGGKNVAEVGGVTFAGVALFVAGSWMNSHAEFARHVWKRRPENRGRLYTRGLFRYTRHPNYLGDLTSFTGLCLISGAWVTAVIPALMLAGFVFVNIPVLDAHLREHYGEAFDEYAAHTRKLIPFVY
jgi:protein-S-isoprenylcysteine O-methyltransferase Ste14